MRIPRDHRRRIQPRRQSPRHPTRTTLRVSTRKARLPLAVVVPQSLDSAPAARTGKAWADFGPGEAPRPVGAARRTLGDDGPAP